MTDYDDKELQHAAQRLVENRDFRMVISVLQDDYKEVAFTTTPEDVQTREACYQRYAVLEELKVMLLELIRVKRERDQNGRS